MARDDSEFSAWLAARWPDLVRSLVFLGHPGPEAERIALEAMSRVLPAWQRLRHEGDVDVELYREVLDERSRHLRHAGAPVTTEPDTEVAPGLTEQAERREEVEATLAAMTPEEREVVVLRHVAELTEQQVDELLGGLPPTSSGPAAEDLRFAGESVPVVPVQAQHVRERVRARRRRWGRRAVAALAAVALVVAAVGWFTARDEDEQGITPSTNPLPLPWHADGVLHLAEVEVQLGPVSQLVRVPDGVVLTDGDGAVIMVDDSGRRRRIGRTVPDGRLVVELDNGWVAWSDPGAGDPEVVVHDTRARAEVGRRSLSVPGDGGGQPVGDSMPLAIDGERVYYRSGDTDYAWEPLLGGAAFAVAGSLVDTANGARVSRQPDGLLVQPAPFRTGVVVDGVDGRLTFDGRYLVALDRAGDLEVYDVGTGRPVDQMYSPSDRVVSWGYVEDGTFVFAVQHRIQDRQYQDLLQLPSEGDYRIYRCDPLLTDPCEELTEVPEDVAEAPVIAG